MAIATHTGEEIEVTFTAHMVKNDYGVDRSPVWYDPEEIEIDMLSILGVEINPKSLPKSLVEQIFNLADNLEFEE